MPTSNLSTRRRRLGIIIPALGVIGALALVGSSSSVFSGFSASINNSNNTIGTGTLLMTETDANAPSYTCLSTASGASITTNANANCSDINKFSGGGGKNVQTAVPGTVYTTKVTIKNNGTNPANAFTLTPAACQQSNNPGTTQWGSDTAFCDKVNITINDDTATKCIYPSSASACTAPTSSNTLTTLGTTVLTLATPVAPGASRTYTFSVAVDSSVTNSSQGLVASKALLWTFGQ